MRSHPSSACLVGKLGMVLTAGCVCWVAAVSSAQAQELADPSRGSSPPSEGTEKNEALDQAREQFLIGAQRVAESEWFEALEAFERSSELRSHAVTTFNIGVCLRAMARYVAARQTFLQALQQDDVAGGKQLSRALRTQAEAFLEEIERIAVHVQVRLVPADAALTVDGRPMERLTAGRGDPTTFVAGVLPPGKGESVGTDRFQVITDPGTRVFVVSRPGFQDVVVNRTFAAGSKPGLDLELARLPAVLHIDADTGNVVVTVNGVDVGVAPVKIARPAGRHRVVMRKPNFVTYETDVSVKPGETANIRGRLPEVQPAITSKWWFWASAGVLVTGAALGTYAATRPEPQRPPPDGGTLGWVIDAR